MYRTISFLKLVTLAFLSISLTAVAAQTELSAAQLTLHWTDNSNNESGFKVERKTGTSGTFTQIAVLAANITSYIDNNLANATTYCYRLNAFNSAGNSAYSDISCATTPSASSTSNFLLSITKAGTGNGRVRGAGIDCGNDCSESFTSSRRVRLRAKADRGSVFAGWTGNGCGNKVNVNAGMNCTATFNLKTYMLKVRKSGKGSGTVTAVGIDCGDDCTERVTYGSTVILTATPANGSVFGRWRGRGCGSSVVVTRNVTCKAIFDVNTSTVTLNESTIDVVALMDRIGVYRPSTGEWFLDSNATQIWEDGADTYVQTFNAVGALPLVGDWRNMGVTQLGLFQPSSLQWHLDLNNNEAVDGCEIDKCEGPFGEPNDIAIVGKWDRNGNDRIGTFRPSNGYWYLDKNGSGEFEGCTKDRCATLNIYVDGDLPVVGDWSGNGITQLGLFRPSTGEWFLDSSGNFAWDGCGIDLCFASFGTVGDLPVSGDWDGTRNSKVGIFRPSTGEWFLEHNGNGQWDGCTVDVCVAGFGAPGDIPVVGRW